MSGDTQVPHRGGFEHVPRNAWGWLDRRHGFRMPSYSSTPRQRGHSQSSTTCSWPPPGAGNTSTLPSKRSLTTTVPAHSGKKIQQGSSIEAAAGWLQRERRAGWNPIPVNRDSCHVQAHIAFWQKMLWNSDRRQVPYRRYKLSFFDPTDDPPILCMVKAHIAVDRVHQRQQASQNQIRSRRYLCRHGTSGPSLARRHHSRRKASSCTSSRFGGLAS